MLSRDVFRDEPDAEVEDTMEDLVDLDLQMDDDDDDDDDTVDRWDASHDLDVVTLLLLVYSLVLLPICSQAMCKG